VFRRAAIFAVRRRVFPVRATLGLLINARREITGLPQWPIASLVELASTNPVASCPEHRGNVVILRINSQDDSYPKAAVESLLGQRQLPAIGSQEPLDCCIAGENAAQNHPDAA